MSTKDFNKNTTSGNNENNSQKPSFKGSLIAGIFFIAAIISSSTWLVFGKGIQRVLQSPKQQRLFNISMALVLGASVLPVIQQLYQQYID